MITLKNGYVVAYDKDFDVFFRSLLEAIIRESSDTDMDEDNQTEITKQKRERYIREIMDNCIYVTHQIFEYAKNDENFSRFMVSGFLFNSIIMALPAIAETLLEKDGGTDGALH
jgi:hypothetical protein